MMLHLKRLKDQQERDEQQRQVEFLAAKEKAEALKARNEEDMKKEQEARRKRARELQIRAKELSNLKTMRGEDAASKIQREEEKRKALQMKLTRSAKLDKQLRVAVETEIKWKMFEEDSDSDDSDKGDDDEQLDSATSAKKQEEYRQRVEKELLRRKAERARLSKEAERKEKEAFQALAARFLQQIIEEEKKKQELKIKRAKIEEIKRNREKLKQQRKELKEKKERERKLRIEAAKKKRIEERQVQDGQREEGERGANAPAGHMLSDEALENITSEIFTAFSDMDQDNNGSITLQEFSDALAKMSVDTAPSPELIDEMIGALEFSGASIVSFEDFVAYYLYYLYPKVYEAYYGVEEGAAANGGDGTAQALEDENEESAEIYPCNHCTACASLSTTTTTTTANGVQTSPQCDIKETKKMTATTPVHAAAMFCHHDCLEALLAAGADPAALDDEHRTPLFCAASSNAFNCCATLLTAAPMTICQGDLRGDTPLHAAAYAGNIECTQLLLYSSADPHAVNNTKRTAMHVAGKLEILQALWEWGASPLTMDEHNRTPLFAACGRGRASCVEFLLRCDDAAVVVEGEDERGGKENEGEVEDSVDSRGSEGGKLEPTGEKEGRESTVEGEGQPKMPTCDEKNPGAFSSSSNPTRASTLVDKHGDSPLHAACCNGHVECARLLLEIPAVQAMLTSQNLLGLTPEEVAAVNNHEECRRLVATLTAAARSNDVNAQLPVPWTVLFDEVSGYEYYYNSDTGETTWDMPSTSSPSSSSSSSKIEMEKEGGERSPPS